MKRVFEVLPGNICIFYLPQNSGPDNILKGNDHRLIKSSRTCFCFPPTSLLFAFFWFNFSKQILCYLKEGKRMPERSFPNQMEHRGMKHRGSALRGARASSVVSSRGQCPWGSNSASVTCLVCHSGSQGLEHFLLREFLTHME